MRITEDHKRAVRDRYEAGQSMRTIAEIAGVPVSLIRSILEEDPEWEPRHRRKLWARDPKEIDLCWQIQSRVITGQRLPDAARAMGLTYERARNLYKRKLNWSGWDERND